MIETEKKTENHVEERWYNLKDLLPLDYWVGSIYKGNYNQRLQINLPALEYICRTGDLPPIVLNTDKWNPPTAHTPEMINPGLSVLKKVAFQKNPDLPEKDKNYYRLTTTETVIEYRPGNNIPVGWDINLKDRKILFDYEFKHPQATQKQKEDHFIRTLNTTIKSACLEVALNEELSLRLLDEGDRIYYIGGKGLQQFLALFPLSFVSYNSLSKFISTEYFNNLVIQSLFRINKFAAYQIAKHKYDKDNVLPNYLPDGHHKGATLAWRTINYPEQEKIEHKNIQFLRYISTAGIPGGVFFDNLYWTFFALSKQKDIFRLAKS
jgi:hypothetical protein